MKEAWQKNFLTGSVESSMKHLNWLEGYYWSIKVGLGTCGIKYSFEVSWNTRDESFEVTIKSLEDEVIISNRKMVLGVDLLEHCHSSSKPNCILIPLSSSNAALERIAYETMISGKIKLYHLQEVAEE